MFATIYPYPSYPMGNPHHVAKLIITDKLLKGRLDEDFLNNRKFYLRVFCRKGSIQPRH